MELLKTLTAFFQAATAYLNRWHLWKLAKLESEIHGIDHQIYLLGKSGTPNDLLRIEELYRDREQLRSLRSALRNPNTRD